MSDSMKIGDIGGTPTFKFEEVGDRCKGEVVQIEKRQSTNMDSGELQTWPDGRPKLYTSITLLIDGEERTVNGAGGNFEIASGEGTSFEAALVKAVKAAKCDSIDAGATLEVVHSGMGKKTGVGKNAPRLYSMKYTPPRQTMSVDDVAGAAPVGSLFSDDES